MNPILVEQATRQWPFLKKFESDEEFNAFAEANAGVFTSLWSYRIAGQLWGEGWYVAD